MHSRPPRLKMPSKYGSGMSTGAAQHRYVRPKLLDLRVGLPSPSRCKTRTVGRGRALAERTVVLVPYLHRLHLAAVVLQDLLGVAGVAVAARVGAGRLAVVVELIGEAQHHERLHAAAAEQFLHVRIEAAEVERAPGLRWICPQ